MTKKEKEGEEQEEVKKSKRPEGIFFNNCSLTRFELEKKD